MPPEGQANDNQGNSQMPHNNKEAVPFLLSLVEINREKYIKDYGEEMLLKHPVAAVAERIGKISLNLDTRDPDHLAIGARLSFKVFDEKKYIAVIESINEYGILSITGNIEKSDPGFLYLSVDDENKVLATLELPDKNAIYLLKYNHLSGNHYLFKAPLDRVKKLEY